MNINNISEGQIFKNYKELCLELGWEVKVSANSKKAQFRELARYCSFNKIGHKIIIEEVYENPHDKIDNRGGNHNTIYGNLIQLLVTDLLAQTSGHISISRSKLMETIGMVNKNYSECRVLVSKLAKYTEIDEKVIFDFYNTSSSNFRSTIETALNNLMDKRIIMYTKIIKIFEKDSNNVRNATNEELELIMNIEKEVLEEMSYKQISSVRISKDWNTFKEKTLSQIHDQSNIEFYYTAYDIIINNKYIIDERDYLINSLLEKVKRKEYKTELNQSVYANLLINAQKRHEKAITSDKNNTRSDESYIENIKQLADLLIDKDSPNILYRIRNIELNVDTFVDDEMDRLFGN